MQFGLHLVSAGIRREHFKRRSAEHPVGLGKPALCLRFVTEHVSRLSCHPSDPQHTVGLGGGQRLSLFLSSVERSWSNVRDEEHSLLVHIQLGRQERDGLRVKQRKSMLDNKQLSLRMLGAGTRLCGTHSTKTGPSLEEGEGATQFVAENMSLCHMARILRHLEKTYTGLLDVAGLHVVRLNAREDRFDGPKDHVLSCYRVIGNQKLLHRETERLSRAMKRGPELLSALKYPEEGRDFLHPICELVQRRSQTLVKLAAGASAFTAEHF